MAENWTNGTCQHCNENLEFEAHHAGQTVACPHCKKDTELRRATVSSSMVPADWNETARYGEWIKSSTPKSIEEKIEIMAKVVMAVSILAAVSCIIAAFNAGSTDASMSYSAQFEKESVSGGLIFKWLSAACGFVFLGVFWMLLLKGFAELIRLNRAKS